MHPSIHLYPLIPFCINCRSLLCKLVEVLSFCDFIAVDIMTFSEDNSVTDLEVCLSNNFSVVCQDGNHREGGFAVCISNQIRYHVCPELSKGYIESL